MQKTKAIHKIEERMEGIDQNSLRYQILQKVKNFKTSWIELGQALYAVSKDRLYRGWGYGTFEAYVAKEIGIHKQTAIKLLKSYYFLEKEEPAYLKGDYAESAAAASLPSYEAVNLLRLAKNKKELDQKDYEDLKKKVFEKGKEAREIKRDLTMLIRQRQEPDPEAARKKREISALKRFLTTLKTLKRDLEISRLVSQNILKEADNLIKKIESEIS